MPLASHLSVHINGQTQAVLSSMVPINAIVDPDGSTHSTHLEVQSRWVNLSFSCAIQRLT